MPQQIVVHSGTVNIIACDIDGYATAAAIRDLGDTAPSTVTVVDTVVGAERYDTLGTIRQTAPAVIQSSKAGQAAADRATLTLTRVRIKPAVEAAGGTSISVGSTVIDQFTETSVTFSDGSGSPTVRIFEDFPSIVSTGGLASSEAFGTATIKLAFTIAAAAGFEPSFDFGVATLRYPYVLSEAGGSLASSEAFGVSGVGLHGFINASGVASAEAFGTAAIALNHPLAAAGLASSEAFGAARLLLTVAAASLASDEAFGAATARTASLLRAFGLASPEAFGAAHMAPTIFTRGTSLVSDGVLGQAAMLVAPPASDAVPVLVAAGELRPLGSVLEGVPLTTTVGVWTEVPTAARFVWAADGVVVRDSGYQAGVWQDSYTPRASDAGKAITVDEYTRNALGDSAAARQDGRALITGLPPSSYGHEALFGPMPSAADVWTAAQDTVRTWLGTYLRERERLSGRAYGALPNIKGWRVYTSQTLASDPGDQFPLCVIAAPGVPDPETVSNDGVITGRFELGIMIVVSSGGGADATATTRLAAEYGAALRSLLTQKGTLGGVVDSTRITGERYDQVDYESQRTLVAAELVIRVRLSGLAQYGIGPTEPLADPLPPDDGGPTLGAVATTFLDIERV
jgi:hypothetical protein